MEGEKRLPSPFQERQSVQKRQCRRSTTKEEDGFVDDMVFEILTWLPAKSLMRFKCVSKAWNTLIRHDVNLHHARCRAIHLLFEIKIPQNYSKLVKSYPTKLERFPLQLVGRCNYFGHREILVCSNQCNGLVCLYNLEDSQGYLYNITTGEIKALPFSLGYKRKWDYPHMFLGYDPATQRYKLLRDIITYKRRPCLKILTLGTNSWRRISGNRLRYLSTSPCAFLNGVLYWNILAQDIITYFNFTEEKYGTLSPPQESRVSEIQTALCGKLIVHPLRQSRNYSLVYDEVNKVFTKFDSDPDLVEGKVASLEPENIPQNPEFIFATSSLISNSTYLVFPDHFCSRHVCRFVENIIPLEDLF